MPTLEVRVYTMQDLCNMFRLSRHAIVHYIRVGVIPGAASRGRYAYYTDEHVRLLRRVREQIHDRPTLTDLAERRNYEAAQGA